MVDQQAASVAIAIKTLIPWRVPWMPYDMAVTSLLCSMMFEKTIKSVATNIGDMNEAVVGGILLPPTNPLIQRVPRRCARTPQLLAE